MTTTTSYRIFGSELSPYSVKVRSYFRFKELPHEWIRRNPSHQAEFERYARLPLIPLVVTPADEGLQDSTPILERLEGEHPEPSIVPHDPALAFLSALIEEFADEWGNKWMFHYRWWYEPDQRSAAARIAEAMLAGGGGASDAGKRDEVATAVKQRMIPRLSFVGSSAATKDVIEASFANAVAIVERHLAKRPYLLGGRPALADFGLWGQLYTMSTDPTPGAHLRERAPTVMRWIERMLEPVVAGDFERWSDLAPTLLPLLKDEVGGRFLPWSVANARALAAGTSEVTVELGGSTFRQQPQKYHARSLGVLRQRYAAVAGDADLDAVLEDSGCRRWLGDWPHSP